MRKDQLYAVVDIEATGASIGRDERMIQFACVLVKNNKIIESFDTFVNPSRKVSRTIRDLTGISSKDLATAPYFEDIAHIIYQLLEDTIFVAHNVGFDYQFLNECFVRVGLSPLTVPAIDTVEMSQILFPRENSYQLKELTRSLGYELENAHNALYDAEATVYLLNKLDEKVKHLPLVTIESLAEFSKATTADTTLFFSDAFEEMKTAPADLDDALIIVEGLALRKPVPIAEHVLHRKKPVYPYTEEEKQLVLDKLGLDNRPNQSAMMNTLFNFFKQDFPSYSQLIEAAPGAGKTFGYMLPAFYLATPEDKCVISTYTKVLQKQLVEEIIPHMNARMVFSQSVALAKSGSHYISLSSFYRKWRNTVDSDTEALFCMKILVWLTETDEGDLEEIGVGSRTPHPFWQEIKPSQRVRAMKTFESVDFFARRQKRLESSAIVVTNHAYLLADWQSQDPVLESDNLILDEAHHFPDVSDQSATLTLRANTLYRDLKQIGSIDKEDSLLYELSQQKSDQIKAYQIQTLESVASVLSEEWEDWSSQWIEWFKHTQDYDPSVVEWKEKAIALNNLPLIIKKDSKRLKATLDELVYIGNQMTIILEDEPEALSKEVKRLLTKLQVFLDRIQLTSETLDRLFFKTQKGSLTGSRFYSKSPTQTLTFYRFDQDIKSTILQKLNSVPHLALTSSTLSVKGSTHYIQKALDIKEAEFSSFDSPYDFAQQGRIFVPSITELTTHTPKAAYASELASQIEKIISHTHENALILFRSQETIQAVYSILQRKSKLHHKTILAQNISGTPVRIAKQVKKSKEVVVLGSDSFWEGVDFPEDELRLVILTKLPFDSPDMPLVKNRHNLLIEEGLNPFVHDLLPRAVMKFKQGIGRLIRSKEDKGIWIILDRRVVESSYASSFIESLPAGLSIEEESMETILTESQSFFQSLEDEE
ncbi:MAG: hypothetical protein JJU16_10140 [Alkalibacterium sp.]|nr:hypothetical protein [Alkalibacterium sp.]